MKRLAIGISVLAVAMIAAPLGAQDVTCDDISFDDRIITTYPAAHDACLEIVESEGVRYAHFKALVHREGFPSMLLRFQNRDGTWGPATLVRIPAGFTVYTDGHAVPAKDVQRGRELSLYIPEGRWEVAMTDADGIVVDEANFAPLEFEVVPMELPEEVDMDAPPLMTDESAAGDAGDAYEAADEAAQETSAMADEDTDDGQSEWQWILGLAAAFIIVWFLLRRRKARRQAP
ncbi:MAG: hypothetical protein Q8W46_05855 [Candidatus Palauibacterales bacterium]|nr:hypothetical protein [Candidatus Palauibacterales bacterium]